MPRKLSPILLVLLLVGVTFTAVVLTSVAPLDPLSEFRNPEGGITVSGGKFTPELQQLFFGPKPEPKTEETVWVSEPSPYPTLSWKSYTFTLRVPVLQEPRAVKPTGPNPIV